MPIRPGGIQEPDQSADACVTALAQVSFVSSVVSEGTSAAEELKPPRDHYVPDVCRELEVPCINLPGLLRREGWELQKRLRPS